MIRANLTIDNRNAVQALRHDATLSPAERDRVEMVLLSDAGWSPPRIAGHLNYHAKTVRLVLRRFRVQGLASLRYRRPGPPPDIIRREQVTAALDQFLGQDRTWTAAQLAEALAGVDICLSARQTLKYLGRMKAHWRRTARTLRHKQDPGRVEHARAQLDGLKKKPRAASSF
jgi:putative transposase